MTPLPCVHHVGKTAHNDQDTVLCNVMLCIFLHRGMQENMPLTLVPVSYIPVLWKSSAKVVVSSTKSTLTHHSTCSSSLKIEHTGYVPYTGNAVKFEFCIDPFLLYIHSCEQPMY